MLNSSSECLADTYLVQTYKPLIHFSHTPQLTIVGLISQLVNIHAGKCCIVVDRIGVTIGSIAVYTVIFLSLAGRT